MKKLIIKSNGKHLYIAEGEKEYYITNDIIKAKNFRFNTLFASKKTIIEGIQNLYPGDFDWEWCKI